jgi:thiol:disulfide interchange protein
MKSSFIVIISFLFVTNISSAYVSADSANSTTEQKHAFDPARNPKTDLEDAVLHAQQFRKNILLDVGGEWCIWCHRLDSLFLQHKDLAEYLNKHYVVVKINVSKENKNQEFLSRYPKVAGYPHLFVLDSKGKLLHSQDTGELEYPKNYPVKGHDKKKVFAFLKKWAK